MTFKMLLLITFGVYVLYYIVIIIYDHLRKGKSVGDSGSEGEHIDVSDFADSGEFSPKEIPHEDDTAYMPKMPEDDYEREEAFGDDTSDDYEAPPPPPFEEEHTSPVVASDDEPSLAEEPDEGVVILADEDDGDAAIDDAVADDITDEEGPDPLPSTGSMSAKESLDNVVSNNAGMGVDDLINSLPDSPDLEECMRQANDRYQYIKARALKSLPHS